MAWEGRGEKRVVVMVKEKRVERILLEVELGVA